MGSKTIFPMSYWNRKLFWIRNVPPNLRPTTAQPLRILSQKGYEPIFGYRCLPWAAGRLRPGRGFGTWSLREYDLLLRQLFRIYVESFLVMLGLGASLLLNGEFLK